MSVMFFTGEKLGALARAAQNCGVVTDLKEAAEWLAIASQSNATAYQVTYDEKCEPFDADEIYAEAVFCTDAQAADAYANLLYNCYSNCGQASIKGGEVEQWLDRIQEAVRKWQKEEEHRKERERYAAIPNLDVDECVKRLRDALKTATGRAWSVTRGRGTGYSWIRVDAPPARRKWRFRDSGRVDDRGMPIYDEVHDPSYEFGHMSPQDREALAEALRVDNPHHQGVSISPERETRWRYVSAAEESAAKAGKGVQS